MYSFFYSFYNAGICNGYVCDGDRLMTGPTCSDKDVRYIKQPKILIAGLWFTVVLIFVLSSILSYQGMMVISIYEEPGPLSSGIWGINPALFWAGRILGTAGTLLIWFFFLRKEMARQSKHKKLMPYFIGMIVIAFICVISWFASNIAAYLSTGFIDIQPKWADNAYIINVPVYIFGVLAAADTVLTGIRAAFAVHKA